eukprot:4492675-Amphidinium_carterae.1
MIASYSNIEEEVRKNDRFLLQRRPPAEPPSCKMPSGSQQIGTFVAKFERWLVTTSYKSKTS